MARITNVLLGVLIIATVIATVVVVGRLPQDTPTTSVPTSQVAPEVCEGQGPPQAVTAHGRIYAVRCASGVVVLVAR